MKRLFALICLYLMFLGNLFAQKADSLASPEAKKYFDEAFRLIKSGSYKNKAIDFEEIYQKSLPYLRGAKTSTDTYEAIKYIITSLNDKHSKFFLPKKSVASRTGVNKFVFPINAQFDDEFALLSLFSFSSTDQALNKKVADSIYSALLQLNKRNIKNLIIDLRYMEGGTIDPFLCGLAPLINKTELLTFVSNDNVKQKIVFERGNLYRITGKSKFGTISLSNYYKNSVNTLNIIILIGEYTASAGEVIAIAFKNLPNVKFVGNSTYGIPTGVALINLNDGASIGLASSVPKDRSGKSYISSLTPDFIFNFKGLSDEEIYRELLK